MKNKIIILPFLLMLLSSPFAMAQENNAYEKSDSSGYKWERFSVSAGMFITGLNNDLSISSQQVGIGAIINIEDALGLKRTANVFRGEAEFNYGKRRRNSLRLEYYGLFREASKVLENELIIGNTTYPKGTEINSVFNFQIYRILYDYNFFLDERVKLGFSCGLYIMPMNFSIHSSINIDENAAFIAPMPVIGFRTKFRITQKVAFIQNIEVLYLDFSEFRGSIVDSKSTIEYFPWKHFGIGIGYNAFRYNVTAYDDTTPLGSFEGSVTSSFTGILVTAKYSL